MIGWTAPKKGRSPKQMRMAAIGVERKKIKTYMARGSEHDAMNLRYADEWLKRRAEFGENDYRIKFAIRVMERLRPELEF